MTTHLRTCRRTKRLCVTLSERLTQEAEPMVAQVIRVALMAHHKDPRPIDCSSIGLVRHKLVRVTLRVSALTYRCARQDASMFHVSVSEHVEACCWRWLSTDNQL